MACPARASASCGEGHVQYWQLGGHGPVSLIKRRESGEKHESTMRETGGERMRKKRERGEFFAPLFWFSFFSFFRGSAYAFLQLRVALCCSEWLAFWAKTSWVARITKLRSLSLSPSLSTKLSLSLICFFFKHILFHMLAEQSVSR